MPRTISFVSNVLHERHDNMKWRLSSALLGWVMVTLSAFAPGDARGSLINCDITTSGGGDAFGPGAAVFGVANSQWNYLSRSTVNASISLNDSLGGATGVTLAYTRTGSGANGPTGAYSALATSRVATGSVVLSGLAPDSNYDLAIFSPSTASFSVAGVTETLTAPVSMDWSSLAQGSQYVLFSSIKSDGTGSLSFTPGAGNVWSGFQIQTATTASVATPEPGTVMLMGSGILGMLGFRRKENVLAFFKR